MGEENINNNNGDYGYNFLELIRIFSRKKKLFINSFIAIFIIGLFYTIIERKQYPTFLGSFTLLVEDPFTKNEKNPNLDNFIEDIASYETKNDIPSIIEVLKSRTLLDNIARKNNIKYENLFKSLLIQKGGNIKNIREEANGVLKISLFGKDKNKISKILDELSKEYLSYSLQQRQDRIKEGLKFLNEQNPGIKERLISIQDEIENLRTANNSVSPFNQSQILDDYKLKFENEKSFLNTQLTRLIKAKDDIEKGNLYATSYKDTITTTEDKTKTNAQNFGLSLDFIDQSSLNELEKLKEKLAKFKTIYTEDSEIVNSIKGKINNLEPKVKESQKTAVESAISSVKLKLAELKKRNDANLKKYGESISLIRKFDVLKQELDLAKENYNAFNSTKEKFRLSIAQNNFPWQIITYPNILKDPIKPNLQKRFFQNLFISLIASSILIIFKDNLENNFHSSYEVKDFLDYEILGSIPYLINLKVSSEEAKNNLGQKNKENLSRREILKFNKEKRNLYAFNESFKFLFNSLNLQKEKKNIKILNFTSTIQGEGKTQTCIELTKKLSRMNKKILLIDADLRRPKIHKRLQINNDIGLSLINNYNSDEFGKLIQNIEGYNNLSIITSGPIIEDPYRIFNSVKFNEFMSWIRNLDNFEYVIFDSATSLFVADTNLLNNKVDYSVLIVSLFKVNKDLVQESINNIKSSEGKILGLVTINTRDNEEIGYNYGVNTYSYGYGYQDEIREKKDLGIFKKLRNLINNFINS